MWDREARCSLASTSASIGSSPGVLPTSHQRTSCRARADQTNVAVGLPAFQGRWVDPAAGRVRLEAFAEKWLEARFDLRPTTQAKYRRLLKDNVFPALGRLPMNPLAPAAVRQWHLALKATHPSTAASAYRLLSTICRTAVEDRVIAQSPCRVKGGGIEAAKERPTASVDEVAAAAAAAAPSHWRLAILLGAWCQLRRGEVLALQRKDVDLVERTLSISQNLTVADGASPSLGPPKTPLGQRVLSIPGNVLPALVDHLDNHVAPHPDAWLFPGPAGGPAHPRTVDHMWSRARRAIGRTDLVFHDLRHTGLTWAATTGASIAEIMRRGGHKSPQAALRYQHATEERDKALADALAALAGGETAPQPDDADISRTSAPIVVRLVPASRA